MDRILRASIAIGALCMASVAYAAVEMSAIDYTREQIDSLMHVFNLDEIVITGTRTPKMLKDTPVTTRLISEAELRRADATNIQDLLQQELPGWNSVMP